MSDSVAAERRALERRIEAGDRRASIELAELALSVVGDDDVDALEAAAALVRDAIAKCRGDGELLALAWELVPESIVAWAPAWKEKPTLESAHRDLGRDSSLTALVEGLLAFHAARWGDAARNLGEVPDDALAAHYLGCALERLGRAKEADRELARAAKLDPERWPKPARMSAKEFESCVLAAQAELPDEIREAIEERFSLVVEDFPSDEAVARGLDPLNLGECRGRDLSELEDGAPAEVVLYKKNLEKICGSKDELVEEIRVTLFHELGHALGFGEEGVDDLGLA